jgi:hypothetical protein
MLNRHNQMNLPEKFVGVFLVARSVTVSVVRMKVANPPLSSFFIQKRGQKREKLLAKEAPGHTGFCGSAPEGRYVYRFVLPESCPSPARRHIACSYVAPDGACELFLAGAINIPRRWRVTDA